MINESKESKEPKESSDEEFPPLNPQELAALQAIEASFSQQLSSKQESNELSYAEIYSSVLLSSEVIITIPKDIEDKVKQGLKNYKAKQALKNKEQGLPWDSTILNFSSTPSQDFENAIELSIALIPKNLVPVLRIKIPDNSF